MTQELGSYGLLPLNVLPTVLAFTPDSSQERYFYKLDSHWTASGGPVTSLAVAQTLKRTAPQVMNGLPKTETILKEVAGIPDPGFAALIASTCDVTVQPETLRQFVAEAGDTSSNDLLGDEVIPVVLFGDSFGGQGRNFDLFLQRDLGVQVLNTSVSGGGPFDAMQSFFLDPDAQVPPLAIWEFVGCQEIHCLIARSFQASMAHVTRIKR